MPPPRQLITPVELFRRATASQAFSAHLADTGDEVIAALFHNNAINPLWVADQRKQSRPKNAWEAEMKAIREEQVARMQRDAAKKEKAREEELARMQPKPERRAAARPAKKRKIAAE
jgi:hypothetical protein